MNDIWIRCFTCGIPNRSSHPTQKRPRIDRSMIGAPTDFRHTAHIGSGDMSSHIHSVQSQMASKGGYDSILKPVATCLGATISVSISGTENH